MYGWFLMKVLLIEDDEVISKMISIALKAEHIVFDVVDSGREALEYAETYDYDILVVDLILPDINGYDVIKEIRAHTPQIPILILSGLTDSKQKIKGLGCGADDYLTKPFDVQELIARLRAVLRRTCGYSDSCIYVDDLVINIDQKVVVFGDSKLHLTVKEWNMFELLVLRMNQLVSRESILSHLYNGFSEPEFKIVDVYACRLRKKIKELTGVNYIKTVWGRGYMFKKPDEAVSA